VTDFSALPPAVQLQESVEKTIDRALEKRPDLIARVAALRASEAEVNRARVAYWPTLSLVGDVGSILGNARVTADGKSTGWFGATQPSYGVGLALEWEIFDGGARRRRVELAESARRAAQDEITATRDRAISDVWKAYTDVKLAFRRLDVTAALVDASQQSYEDSLKSYTVGLGTLTDLLAARRELSRARFVDLDTKVQLLESSAALAFTTGEIADARVAPDR
jgi:outer membrane protein TolC